MTIDSDRLRAGLAEHLDVVDAPRADLAAVRRRGRRLRRRRNGLATAAVATCALGVTVTGVQLLDSPREPGGAALPSFAATGNGSTSDGLRAYASPGVALYMAGRTFPADALDYLDTDAVATPHGVVMYDAGLPVLLAPDGSVTALAEGPTDGGGSFHPTAKADRAGRLVAFATLRGSTVTLTVHDLEERSAVATGTVPCDDDCSDVVIDAIDSGTVFVRLPSGTVTWDFAADEWRDFSGSRTRVADVRNGVVLYDGRAPASLPSGWRAVPGAIDSLLSYDGRYLLGWSSTLEPTTEGDEPVVLEQGPADGDGLAWWAFDTDGSVLVAVAVVKDGVALGDNVVYDCEVPSGRCTDLGPLTTRHGDPLFIGVDM
jgi:hypothetical protein